LDKHIYNVAPTGVTVDVKKENLSAIAYKVDPDHPLIQKAATSYTKSFGKETINVRMVGSISVVEWIVSIYNIAIVVIGFDTLEGRLHSPNESFPLDSFDKGMETLVHYWHAVAVD